MARGFIRRHAIGVYFGFAYLFSTIAALLIYGPQIAVGRSSGPMAALTTFPLMVVGVGLTGIALTAAVDGRAGLGSLFGRIGRWRVGIAWYAVALLLPPVLIGAVLFVLRSTVSPAFAPNFFLLGILFGVPAGFFEEIGWTGYLLPRLVAKRNALPAAIGLGVLWGLWHTPVVDSLGSASPHGAAWLGFFLAFVALVAAIRVVIVWLYRNTGSVLLAQILHASSTGSLVIFGPAGVTPGQEALWYAVYAAVLWVVVGAIARRYGTSLTGRRSSISEPVRGREPTTAPDFHPGHGRW